LRYLCGVSQNGGVAERQDASTDPWRAAPADVALGDDEAHVWRVDLRAGAGALAPLLSADERARVAGLARPRDRTRFTVARASLRRILARYVGDAADELRFVYGPHGKPALAGAAACGSGAGDVQFNLSHAGLYKGLQSIPPGEKWQESFWIRPSGF